MGCCTVEKKNTHTLKVVIDGEEIQAEYFEFNYKHDSSYKPSLWDKVTLPFYRIKNKFKDVYWKVRYGFQRMFKGYDNVDTFETFAKFIERYSKILTELRKDICGHPVNLTEEEWVGILDDMIRHLYYMDEENVIKELTKGTPKSWVVSGKTTDEIMEKHKNEFFKLFSEYFYNLWD